MSKAGKEILIKAVAQATPTYSISCFKLPDSLCEDLTSLIRNFWWGQRQEEKKMVWLSWKKLRAPKASGGMGFKSLKEFNLAMLAKQGWQLQQRQNSLAYHVLKSKYFPHYDFSQATLGNNPSFTWRSLMAAQDIVKYGLRWRIGNDERVRVWGDKWLQTPSTYQVTSPRMFLQVETLVCDLIIDRENACWKTEVTCSHDKSPLVLFNKLLSMM